MRTKAPMEARGIDFLPGTGGTVGYKSLEMDAENRSQVLSKSRHTLIHHALCPAYTDFSLIKPWAWGNSILSRKKMT